jgi:hypothetical protein
MRDDVFGLSSLRALPATVRAGGLPNTPLTNKPQTTTPRANTTSANMPRANMPRTNMPMPSTSLLGRSSFATQLASASKARAAAALHKPYVSPMKQNQASAPSPNAYKPAPPKTSSPSSSSLAPPSHPTAPVSRPKPTKPLAPAAPPEAARPPVAPNLTSPLALSGYPHPQGDNGRGMHWVPTTKQSNAVVDRFVGEAQRMGVKWVTFLNDGASVDQNDYLVSKLVGAGIEPVMRLYSAKLEPIQGDIEGMVRHYVSMGVHYFQPFNEPNLSIEQPDGVPSVDRYLNAWIPAAQAIVRGGGHPGFGSLAPGGDKNDVTFLTEALEGLRSRGKLNILDRAWLSMHNYTHNHAIEERADTDGFFKFRAYHKIMQAALGRDVPIIGTEGGTFVGEHEDTTQPAVTASTAVSMSNQAFSYMRDKREPWNFAYSFWTIANEAGGGTDQGFSQQALFHADGSVSPIVSALRTMA